MTTSFGECSHYCFIIYPDQVFSPDSRNDPNRAITLGNGEPISAEAMADVIAIADELTADIAWHAGDVALIDNFTVMHGRRPFAGKRRVLASLIS